MSKTQNLKNAYDAIKMGETIKCGYYTIWIDTCDRPNAPDYGKEYIYWYGYGSSATDVSLEKLRWIMEVICGSSDCSFTIE